MPRLTLIILALGVMLAACQAQEGADPTPTGSPTPSGRPSEAPTDSPSPTPSSPPETPSASPEPVIALDSVVETIVERLTIRREPGTAGERIGFLELGTVAFVLAGPQEIEGIPWYRVTGMGLPNNSGCIPVPEPAPLSCPAFQGWLAGASESGDPWLATTAHEPCPQADVQTIGATGFTWRLVCWADEPITIEAWWPEIPDDAGLGGLCLLEDEPGGFLYCQNINYNGLLSTPEVGFFDGGLNLSIDPASGVEMPERGQWVRVTGKFDHPAAEACAQFPPREGEDAISVVFTCRLQFVPTSVEPIAG